MHAMPKWYIQRSSERNIAECLLVVFRRHLECTRVYQLHAVLCRHVRPKYWLWNLPPCTERLVCGQAWCV